MRWLPRYFGANCAGSLLTSFSNRAIEKEFDLSIKRTMLLLRELNDLCFEICWYAD
jgi:hypothetical protein